MGLSDTLIKTCLMSSGANTFEQLLEKAMDAEKRLSMNGKTNVN